MPNSHISEKILLWRILILDWRRSILVIWLLNSSFQMMDPLVHSRKGIEIHRVILFKQQTPSFLLLDLKERGRWIQTQLGTRLILRQTSLYRELKWAVQTAAHRTTQYPTPQMLTKSALNWSNQMPICFVDSSTKKKMNAIGICWDMET